VDEYFASDATIKLTFWKGNERKEAKPFEIPPLMLSQFFLAMTTAGTESMTMNIAGAHERLLSHRQAVIECPHAIWTFTYGDGYVVALNGPLTAYISAIPNPPQPSQSSGVDADHKLKIDKLAFDGMFQKRTFDVDMTASPPPARPRRGSHRHNVPLKDEIVNMNSERSTVIQQGLPDAPFNMFGIPVAAFRHLELVQAQADLGMARLIEYATEHNVGPRAALSQMANEFRGLRVADPIQGESQYST